MEAGCLDQSCLKGYRIHWPLAIINKKVYPKVDFFASMLKKVWCVLRLHCFLIFLRVFHFSVNTYILLVNYHGVTALATGYAAIPSNSHLIVIVVPYSRFRFLCRWKTMLSFWLPRSVIMKAACIRHIGADQISVTAQKNNLFCCLLIHKESTETKLSLPQSV